MSDTLLKVEDLTVRFGNLTAVDGISFSVNRGETVGIVGESGSGKSITSLAVMRLLPPSAHISSGSIQFYPHNEPGIDLLKIQEKAARHYRGKKAAMIFQEPMTSLNPVFTCGAQVAEAILAHERISKKQAKARVLDLFQEVLLPRPEQIYTSYPHQLSGGQKQRVMIAMAMSCRPDLLIADEPTTALDVTVQKTILELMGKLRREFRMGMMFITHDLGVIAELADRVIVMYKGKIVEEGKVLDIFSRPQHPYTKGLLACRPPLDIRLRKLPVVGDFLKTENNVLTESGFAVHDVLDQLTVTGEERKQLHSALYQQEPVLKVKDLCTWFPVKTGLLNFKKNYIKAVDHVSFEVYPGETLGLVGESGCGKTTLGRSILRLIEPVSGAVEFENTDLTTLSAGALRKMRKNMQIIFQDPYSSLNPRMTIGEAITEPMWVHRIFSKKAACRDKTIELLEKVSLGEEHYYRYPHEFSGGQRQRIVIARALALMPKFIICDESVSALDVSVQAQVLNLLNDLKREFGFTYIFISHDLSVVKFMSDRMIVMNQGKIEEIGDADEIYHHPKSAYTQKLIDAVPKGRLEDIRRAVTERGSGDGSEPNSF